MSATRTERDSLGEVEVGVDAYWGAQTERARRNFPVSGLRFPRRFIAALGLIKGECAAVNAELGIVAPELAAAIRVAAAERSTTGSSTGTFRSTSSRPAPARRPT